MKNWSKILIVGTTLFLFQNPVNAISDDVLKNRISDKIDELDYLRDELAQKSKNSLDADGKYLEACEVIQRNLVKMAKRTGWDIRQPVKKARNPINKKISPTEKAAFDKFKNTPRLGAYWLRDDDGFWYFRQIKTETKCLACHGSAGKRPQTVKANYPNDRGYGLKDGEFYGVFSVFVADKKKAKKKPVKKVVKPTPAEEESSDEEGSGDDEL